MYVYFEQFKWPYIKQTSYEKVNNVCFSEHYAKLTSDREHELGIKIYKIIFYI
jgi:hypothetical protein